MNKLAFTVVFLAAASAHAESPWIGLALGSDGKFGGAKVNQVIPKSPGERAGIHAGDEVIAIDDAPTTSPQEVIAAVLRGGIGHHAKLRLVDEKGHTRAIELVYGARPDREKMQRDSILNRPAPDFLPKVQVGDKVPRISALKGRVVVIDFFATWCGPCIEAMPHIEAMHKRLKDKGVTVLGVSHEEADVVGGAAGRFHVSYPLAADVDEKVSAAYQVFALPTMVVIDKKGFVREVAVADTDALDAAVASALKAN
jgi:thiol-disulfide isomerase/thioredoxin